MPDTAYWFLSYVSAMKRDAVGPGRGPESHSNVVLAGIHPLVWLSTPPAEFGTHFITWALFFEEISEELFYKLQTLNYISCEDYRNREKRDG